MSGRGGREIDPRALTAGRAREMVARGLERL